MGSSWNLPRRVRVVEVGPRDGLQNEPDCLATADKIAFIDRLSGSGLSTIEVGSLVSPAWVPQLADAEAVWRGMRHRPGVGYPLLVPNQRGLQRALALGVERIALFATPSEAFCRRNLNCSVSVSLERYAPLLEVAQAEGLGVRVYLSCAWGCPYQGAIPGSQVAALARHFLEAGCDELCLADTIGRATPLAAARLIEQLIEVAPLERLAVHFHDTRGQALANTLACLSRGVAVVDAAVAGLGGCPFAPGAAGNLASEELVFMLQGMGIETGIDLPRLIDAGRFVCAALGRGNRSRVAAAEAVAHV